MIPFYSRAYLNSLYLRQKLLEDYKRKKIEQELGEPASGANSARGSGSSSSATTPNRGHSQPPFGRPKSQSNVRLPPEYCLLSFLNYDEAWWFRCIPSTRELCSGLVERKAALLTRTPHLASSSRQLLSLVRTEHWLMTTSFLKFSTEAICQSATEVEQEPHNERAAVQHLPRCRVE